MAEIVVDGLEIINIDKEKRPCLLFVFFEKADEAFP